MITIKEKPAVAYVCVCSEEPEPDELREITKQEIEEYIQNILKGCPTEG